MYSAIIIISLKMLMNSYAPYKTNTNLFNWWLLLLDKEIDHEFEFQISEIQVTLSKAIRSLFKRAECSVVLLPSF